MVLLALTKHLNVSRYLLYGLRELTAFSGVQGIPSAFWSVIYRAAVRSC